LTLFHSDFARRIPNREPGHHEGEMEHWLNDLPLPSVDIQKADTIHAIARRNDVNTMLQLLEMDPGQILDTNDSGFTALHICAIYGKERDVRGYFIASVMGVP